MGKTEEKRCGWGGVGEKEEGRRWRETSGKMQGRRRRETSGKEEGRSGGKQVESIRKLEGNKGRRRGVICTRHINKSFEQELNLSGS